MDRVSRRTPSKERATIKARRVGHQSKERFAARGHWVYLARCSDGTYYCGYARSLVERIAAHNAGKGSKILRGKLPVRLVYARRFATKGAALSFELALKQRSHAEKHSLALHRRMLAASRGGHTSTQR